MAAFVPVTNNNKKVAKVLSIYYLDKFQKK